MNLAEKIAKKEREILLLQEKIKNKKIELKTLRKKKEDQEQLARARKNEQVIRTLEEKIGGDFSLEELELLLQDLPEKSHIQSLSETDDKKGEVYESY